jgi:hypothetical protein
VRNGAGTRPPSSSGASGSGWCLWDAGLADRKWRVAYNDLFYLQVGEDEADAVRVRRDLHLVKLRADLAGPPSRAQRRWPSLTPHAMNPHFQRARTLSNHGFMSFERALSGWAAVLAVLA